MVAVAWSVPNYDERYLGHVCSSSLSRDTQCHVVSEASEVRYPLAHLVRIVLVRGCHCKSFLAKHFLRNNPQSMFKCQIHSDKYKYANQLSIVRPEKFSMA
jgi:hypothetical protein